MEYYFCAGDFGCWISWFWSSPAAAWAQAVAATVAIGISYRLGRHAADVQLSIEKDRREEAERKQKKLKDEEHMSNVVLFELAHGFIVFAICMLLEKNKLNKVRLHDFGSAVISLRETRGMLAELIFKSFPSSIFLKEVHDVIVTLDEVINIISNLETPAAGIPKDVDADLRPSCEIFQDRKEYLNAWIKEFEDGTADPYVRYADSDEFSAKYKR